MKFKVLSLYDGMSGGALALMSAGVEIESYDAFEIDKYAVQTSSHNFPFIKHHGDVFKADFTQFEGVDLVCGGSPCTYWSIAQKNNRETEASGMGWELFQQYVRAIKEAKPKFFIYENNKSMSKAIRQSIDETFGFEAVLINSALVSAQNRQRLYWVGRRNEDGTYSKVNVEQPEDRGIVLRDILESGVIDREKSYPLLVSHQGNARDYFKKGHAQIVCEPINTTDGGDKARTLMAGYYKYGTATLITNEGFKGGTTAVAEGVNVTDDGKSQTLKAQYHKNNVSNFCCYNSTYGATGVAEPVRIPPYGVEDKARPINALYPNNCGGFEHRMFSENPNKQQVDMVAEPVRIPEYGEDDKSRPVITAYSKRGTCENQVLSNCFPDNPNKQLSDYVAEPVCADGDKAKTLTASYYKYAASDSFKKANPRMGIAEPIYVGEVPEHNGVYRNGKQPSQQYRVYSVDGKSVACDRDSRKHIAESIPVFATACEWDEEGKPIKAISTADGKAYTVYEVKGSQITIKGKQYSIKLADGFYIIRKLTVRECMRLQTVPEWYVFPVSDTQAYKMLGNGWTIEVISHLIKACLSDKGDEPKLYEQMRLF